MCLPCLVGLRPEAVDEGFDALPLALLRGLPADLLRLLLYGFLENFGFRQFLTLVKVKALLDTLLRRRGWGRMDRRGFEPGDTDKHPPPRD